MDLQSVEVCSTFVFCRRALSVKLIRAQNDHHAKHIHGFFCTATIRHLKELGSMLGSNEVCFVSQDEKAHITIGLTVANLLINASVESTYLIRLSCDHMTKLISMVYAGIQIKSNGLGIRETISYSGLFLHTNQIWKTLFVDTIQ